jgi:hypothetical protein
MKNLTKCMIIALALLTFMPIPLNAVAEFKAPSSAAKTVETTQTNALVARLNTIKAMDKSNMSGFEKKQLRKETRSIKKSLKALSGGVYLTTGAIIIIILLLILLL